MAFSMCIWVYMVWFMSWYNVPTENKEMFLDIKTTSRDIMFMIGTYLFGSSLSSQRHSETIASLAQSNQNIQDASQPNPVQQ